MRRVRTYGARGLLIGLALALGLAGPSWAQGAGAPDEPGSDESDEPGQSNEPDRLEGLTLEEVEVVAPPREDVERLRALSGLEPGQPFLAVRIRRAVEALHQLGRFADVEAFARREGNVVRLRLVLSPRPVVRALTVRGTEELSDEVVLRAVGYKVGDEVSFSELADRRLAVRAALERRGHRVPAIGLALESPDDNGGVELVVVVDEGPVTRLGRLVVRGTPRRPLWVLAERFGVGPGDVLDLDALDAGVARIAAEYRALGYWDARVSRPEIRTSSASSAEDPRADVVLTLDAGPRVRLRSSGHTAVPEVALVAAAGPLVELGTGPAALSELRDRVQLLYIRRGYWRAAVEVTRRESPDGTQAEVHVAIREGPRGYVRRVSFPGNAVLEPDLLREVVTVAVARALGDEGEVPEADPRVVDAVVGARGGAPRAVDPYAARPDPRTLWFDRGYRAGAEAIADVFRAEGHQLVEVGTPKLVVRGEGTELEVEIPVTPGPVWRIGALSLRGPEQISREALLEVAAIEPGQPLSFFEVEEARRAIQTYYRQRGYYYARVDESLAPLVRGTLSSTVGAAEVRKVCAAAVRECAVELSFSVREGPEVRTRRVIVRGGDGVRRALVDGELAVTEGELLTEGALAETQRNLLRLGVFRRATVRPVDEEAEAEEKDVLVDLIESKHSSFEVGGGVSTEEGVRAFANYAHGNVLGSALRFQASAKVNAQPFFFFYNDAVRDAIADFYVDRPLEYLLAVGFAYPRVLGLPRGFGAGLDLAVAQNNEPAFAESIRIANLTLDYSGLRPRILGAERGVGLQLRGSVQWADLQCNGVLVGTSTQPSAGARQDLKELCGASSDDPVRRLEGTTFYTGLRLGFSLDLRDDPLEPRSGAYFEVQPELLLGWNDQSPSHVNLRGKLNGYVPLVGRSSLALSLVWLQLFAFDPDATIPVNRRFFAGGRSTIRGYPEQTLFPRQAGVTRTDGQLSPGGELMVALKTELRFPLLEGLEGALFYDVGDLFDRSEDFAVDGDTRQGVGFGVRYATPIGPLLLDIAFPLVRREDELTWVPHFAAVGSF